MSIPTEKLFSPEDTGEPTYPDCLTLPTPELFRQLHILMNTGCEKRCAHHGPCVGFEYICELTLVRAIIGELEKRMNLLEKDAIPF